MVSTVSGIENCTLLRLGPFNWAKLPYWTHALHYWTLACSAYMIRTLPSQQIISLGSFHLCMNAPSQVCERWSSTLRMIASHCIARKSQNVSHILLFFEGEYSGMSTAVHLQVRETHHSESITLLVLVDSANQSSEYNYNTHANCKYSNLRQWQLCNLLWRTLSVSLYLRGYW